MKSIMNFKQREAITALLGVAMHEGNKGEVYVYLGGLDARYAKGLDVRNSYLVTVAVSRGLERHVVNAQGEREYVCCGHVDQKYWELVAELFPPTAMILKISTDYVEPITLINPIDLQAKVKQAVGAMADRLGNRNSITTQTRGRLTPGRNGRSSVPTCSKNIRMAISVPTANIIPNVGKCSRSQWASTF